MTPEGLDSLGKQELIALILAQQEQICQLSARVAELEARLNLPPKTPSNSSLPPSMRIPAKSPTDSGINPPGDSGDNSPTCSGVNPPGARGLAGDGI
jgi:hypothetical protein